MKSYLKFLQLGFSFVFMIVLFASCQQDEIVTPSDNQSVDERTTTTTAYPNVTFYGLGLANELYTYRSGPPATQIAETIITGLREGERILAIDFRPANRVLYGVSNLNLIYSINTSGFGTGPVGTATRISQAPFSPVIEGTTVGFDFNPATDRIHLITDKGQNLRISPTTGQVIGVDQYLSGSGSILAINSAAFSNNFSGTTGTSLYDVDYMQGKVYRQSGSSMTLIGSTGLTITGEGGFDISRTGAALGVYNAYGRPVWGSTTSSTDDGSQQAYRLYGINLRTGAATNLGKVKPMIGLSIL